MASSAVAETGETQTAAGQQLHTDVSQRILFVGNSYLYYNDSLHNHVERMAEAQEPELRFEYKSATIGGADLSQHHIDSLLEPGRLGIDEPFDIVVLQGGSFEPLTEESRAAFAETVAELDSRIRATGAVTALYMTHAYVDPHPRVDPQMIDMIVETYVSTGDAIDALVLPVGLAFELAYERRPDIELHKSFDGSHPSMLGTYLAACVVYASIYRRPASDVDYDYFGAVSEEDAIFLRAIADETVSDFFDR